MNFRIDSTKKDGSVRKGQPLFDKKEADKIARKAKKKYPKYRFWVRDDSVKEAAAPPV